MKERIRATAKRGDADALTEEFRSAYRLATQRWRQSHPDAPMIGGGGPVPVMESHMLIGRALAEMGPAGAEALSSLSEDRALKRSQRGVARSWVSVNECLTAIDSGDTEAAVAAYEGSKRPHGVLGVLRDRLEDSSGEEAARVRAVLMRAVRDRRKLVRETALAALGGTEQLAAADRAEFEQVRAKARRVQERATTRTRRAVSLKTSVGRVAAGFTALAIPVVGIWIIVGAVAGGPERVKFASAGSPCGDSEILYLDREDGDRLECPGYQYSGPLSRGEQQRVKDRAAGLASDSGGLTDGDQDAVHDLAAELAPESGLVEPGQGLGLVVLILIFGPFGLLCSVALLALAFPNSALVERLVKRVRKWMKSLEPRS